MSATPIYSTICWGEIVEIQPGDTIHTPPGEWHWHGATPQNFMTHLAMWESLAEGQQGPETEWGGHVVDEYPAH